jgi:hypothetical protein
MGASVGPGAPAERPEPRVSRCDRATEDQCITLLTKGKLRPSLSG